MRTALKYNPECVTFFFIVMVTSYVQYTFGFWSETERPMCIRLSCGPLCNEIFSFRLLVLSHAQPCRPWAFQVSSSSSSCSSCGLSTPVTGSLEVRTRFVACQLDAPGLDWIFIELVVSGLEFPFRVRRIDYLVCFRDTD